MQRRLGLLVVAGLLGVPAACSDLRVKVDVFDSVEDARASGAIAAGWIPDGLPKDAADLREGHLPDGRHWGAFTFPQAAQATVQAMVGQEITAGTLTCDPPGRLEWWPRLVQSPVDVVQVRTTGFRIYRGPDARIYVVNWGQGRAYYWH